MRRLESSAAEGGGDVGTCAAILMFDDEFCEESPWSVELTKTELEELQAWEHDGKRLVAAGDASR